MKRKKEEVNKKEMKEEEEETQDEVVKPALGEVTHVPFNWPILSDEVLIQRSRQFYEVIFFVISFWYSSSCKELPSLIRTESLLKTIA